MTRAAALWILSAVSCLAGCACEEELSEDQKLRGGEEVVRAFYRGLEQESCDVISPLLVEAHTEADCHELVEELSERQVSLVDVVEAKVDGRDPNAVIVKVRIRDQGRESQLLMRAEREDGAWKLRM